VRSLDRCGWAGVRQESRWADPDAELIGFVLNISTDVARSDAVTYQTSWVGRLDYQALERLNLPGHQKPSTSRNAVADRMFDGSTRRA